MVSALLCRRQEVKPASGNYRRRAAAARCGVAMRRRDAASPRCGANGAGGEKSGLVRQLNNFLVKSN
jgi:hypothetical protein